MQNVACKLLRINAKNCANEGRINQDCVALFTKNKALSCYFGFGTPLAYYIGVVFPVNYIGSNRS